MVNHDEKLTLADLTQNKYTQIDQNNEQENLQNILKEESLREENDELVYTTSRSRSEFEKNILAAMKADKEDFIKLTNQKIKIAEFDKKMKRIKKIKSRSFRRHLKIAKKKNQTDIEIPEYLSENVEEMKKDKVFHDENLSEKVGKMIHIESSSDESSTDSECELMKNDESNEDEHVQLFKKEKQEIIEKDMPKEKIDVLPGWGAWGGYGIETIRTSANTLIHDEDGIQKNQRKDFRMSRVIINENALKNNISVRLPYGFDKKEYEAWLNVPVSRQSYSQKVFNKFIANDKNATEKKKNVQTLEYKSKYDLHF